MSNSESRPPSSPSLIACWMVTIVAAVAVAFISMLMALGTGLASSPDDPVESTSQVLWSVSGFAFLPCVLLLLLLTAKRERIYAIIIAMILIAAGLIAAAGWFIDSGGELPSNSGGTAMLMAVMVVPLIAAAIISKTSDRLS